MLFSVIPIVSWWAAYRIEKLRKFLIISLPLYVAFNLLFSNLSILFHLIIVVPIVVYFVRKWSIEWNEKIDMAKYPNH